VPAPKKVPQTDAIFAELKQTHEDAAASRDTLRLSLDAKATVTLGPFSRGGKSRTGRQAADHDFEPLGRLTPFGIFLPGYDELDLYFTHSKVTSDFIADALGEWWQRNRERFAWVRQLVIDLDNGPENHSRRTQFLYRMVQFAQQHRVSVQLAYYPPYHSKYNPIERCWGVLEMHWNGSLLDSVEAVLGFARSMTWKGKHPVVSLVETTYAKGVRLKPEEMKALEAEVIRTPSLEKWFVKIPRKRGRPRKT
jgi:Rhodopirellula transposase DDE domain